MLDNNCIGGKNEVFVTLTYAKNMTLFSQLTRDYDRFWRRLCNKYKHMELACIYVKEMQQKRRSWHIHSLIKEVNDKTFIIPFKLLGQMWGLGNVWINRVLPTYDNTDYQINIEKEMSILPHSNPHSYNKIIDYMCKLKTKDNEFPSGVKIHGNKGKLKGPKKSKMSYGEAEQKKLNNSILTNENTLLVIDEHSNKTTNCIHKEYWVEDKPDDKSNK